ncbi:MAG: hypothetical protein ACRYG4_26145 [Janthinobacterium lividum]
MTLPHLSHWAGAVAGLRVAVWAMCMYVAWEYRAASWRTLTQRRFTDAVAVVETDVLRGSNGLFGLGFVVVLTFGLWMIVRTGGVPADAFLFSRIAIIVGYGIAGIASSISIIGFTVRKLGPSAGKAQAARLGGVTIALMVFGALL